MNDGNDLLRKEEPYRYWQAISQDLQAIKSKR